MRVDLLTLFPAMCRPALEESILGRARAAGLLQAEVHDLRTFGLGRHRTVDDSPYGGGSGMVMRVDVAAAAIESVRQPESWVLLMDPSGVPFDQEMARRLARCPHLVLLAGHYEGVDGRVREQLVDEAISIGDYVLTGGELAALVVIDAVARLIPGVLGNPESLTTESFEHQLLEAPCYTRPREWESHEVPEILLSGHHAAIDQWRRAQSESLTRRVRPDLWASHLAQDAEAEPEPLAPRAVDSEDGSQ